MTDNQTEATKTSLDLHDNRRLPVGSFPVPEPTTNWATKITDYNEDDDKPWDGEFMNTVSRGGNEYYDLSTIGESNLLRVNTADGPVIFGVNDITDDAVEVVQLDEDTARTYIEIDAHRSTPDDDSDSLSLPSDGTDDSDPDQSTSDTSSDGTEFDRNNDSLPVTENIGDMDMRGMLSGRSFDASGEPLEDPGDAPLIGFQLIYTTGSSLLVPRDELLAKMDDLGLPEWMAPPKVKPYAAFGRMVDDLIGGEVEEYMEVPDTHANTTETVKFDFPKNDGTRDRTLDAKKYVQNDETGEGEWTDHLEIAHVWYDSETQNIQTVLKDGAKGTMFEDKWEREIEPTIHRLFEMHQEHHNGRDINTKVMNKLVKQWTESIRIRDAVYFVPAIYGGIGDHKDTQSLLQAFVEFYEWLDEEYKHMGKDTRLHAVPIYNTEEEKRMVTESVLDELEDDIEDLFEDLHEELIESDLSDEIVGKIVDERTDQMENVAERYAQIADDRLSIERILQERLRDVETEYHGDLRKAIERHSDITTAPPADD